MSVKKKILIKHDRLCYPLRGHCNGGRRISLSKSKIDKRSITGIEQDNLAIEQNILENKELVKKADRTGSAYP